MYFQAKRDSSKAVCGTTTKTNKEVNISSIIVTTLIQKSLC